IDGRSATDLGRVTATDVAFRERGRVAVSTLSRMKEVELEQQAHDSLETSQVSLGNERYYATSVALSPAFQTADLVVLKSYKEAAAYLRKLNRLLLGLGLATILAGGGLIFLISNTVTRPLGSLVEGVQALEQGNFTYPLEAS